MSSSRWKQLVGVATIVAVPIALLAWLFPQSPTAPPERPSDPASSVAEAGSSSSRPPVVTTTTTTRAPVPPPQETAKLHNSGSIHDFYPIDLKVDIESEVWNDAYGSIKKYAIAVTKTNLSGIGVQIVPVTGAPSYGLCKEQAYQRSSFTWDQVPPGTAACMRRKDGRFGWFNVQYKRDEDGLHDFTIAGEVWE